MATVETRASDENEKTTPVHAHLSMDDYTGKHEHEALEKGIDPTSLEMTPAEYRKLRTKIDLKTIPYFALLYLLSFLDRANIGQARTANLEADLGLLGTNHYQVALTVFFVTYVFFEIPAIALLRKIGPHRLIAVTMLLWSITMIFMGFVTDYGTLVTARFFLGVFEAPLFPALNYLLTFWYSRQEQNLRIGIFFAGATLAGAFGGLLAFGIRQMAGVGGKDGWSWIFILEGLLTFLCALPAYFIIPDFPDRAKHLTERERTQWLHHLHKSQGVTTAPVPITRRRIIDAFLDWRTYAYAVLYITIAMPFYGVSLFLPTVIKGLGYTNAQANLFSVPPFAVGFATTLASAWLSDRFSMRGPFLMFWMSLCIIGYAVAITPQSYAVQYGMLFLITGGVSPGIATAIAYVGANFGPLPKRAIAMGLFFSVGNAGGMISSNIYPASDGPMYRRGNSICLGFACAAVAIAGVLTARNYMVNQSRDRQYGKVTPQDCTLDYLLSPEGKKRFGYEGLSDDEVLALGDNHVAFRYFL